MRIKSLAIAALALAGLAVPASASAVTYIGSGSVAAQPVLQALFKTVHQGDQPQSPLRLHGERGQRRRQRRPERDQPVRRQRANSPPQRRRHHLHQDVHGRSLPRRQQEHAQQHHIQQTHDIYRGLLTNWSQVPGGNLTTTIDPVGRDTNGGTYNFFLQAVLNNEAPASNVNALTADGLVVNAVKQDPNAIGYAGLAWQGSKKMHALKVNGIPCEAKKISVEPLKYPLSRYLFMVLPGDGTQSPKGLLKFVDWMRTSKRAGEVITKAGGVPAFNKKK